MHLSTTLSYISLLAVSASALPSPKPKPNATKPPYFVLAGDSTTAVQSTGGGGWGTGFLTTTLKKGASGHNYGHNGATTVTFRQGGDWATVLSAAKNASSHYSPYVTIQFGHNDQKPDKNISAAALTTNLVAYVNEVRDVGATPILVTSLSRRSYGTDGKIKLNLADVAAATEEAASKSGASIIDLNAASTEYLNAIGAEKAHTYNLIPTDNTHLNAAGSVVFGNLVAMLIREEIPALSKYVKPVASVQKALQTGVYILPEV
jgi:lysophospholipase L1-like esterase